MKKILIIATGGTIAGTGASGQTTQYKCGELDVNTLLCSVPHVHEIANVSGIQLLNIPSDDITTANLVYMSKMITEMSNEYDGFVITHGTDTLEETAYFLNLTLNTNKPVVVTGAMRPSTAISADGPQNLYQSIVVASSEKAYGSGVLVVFSDAIYSAREVTKVSTQATKGFDGRDFGAIGYIHDNCVELVNSTTKKHTINSMFEPLDNLENIPILYFHIDADPALLEFSIKNSEAIVVAGAGNGCISILWEDVLKKYPEKTVVLTSRVANGAVIKNSSLPKNCLSGGSINPQKARILLQLAISKTSNQQEIQEIFEQY